MTNKTLWLKEGRGGRVVRTQENRTFGGGKKREKRRNRFFFSSLHVLF